MPRAGKCGAQYRSAGCTGPLAGLLKAIGTPRSAAPLGPPHASKLAAERAPPRKTRFGSPLVLARVHWVEPQLVAEITYLTWTADGLLRHTVYLGLRSDKPATQIRREVPRKG